MGARTPGSDRLLLLGVTLAAFALRLVHLTKDPLWWDEGISVYLATRPLAELTVAKDFALDLHPPLYHLLLAGWQAVAGPSVFAMRFFSILIGVATVPFVARLGARVDGPRAGVIAAALLVLAPLHIHHSQEVRLYPLVTLIGALYLLALLDYLDPKAHAARTGLALAGTTALALYTYYYLAFLPATAQAIAVAGRQLLGHRRFVDLLRWHALGGLAFAPFFIELLRVVQSGETFGIPAAMQTNVAPWQIVTESARAFVAGSYYARPVAEALVILSALVVGVGLLRRDDASRGRWLLIGAVIGPVLLAVVVSQWRPYYLPRLLIFVLPAIVVLAAAGIATLARWSRAVAIVAGLGLAIGLASTLVTYYGADRFAFASRDFFAQLEDLVTYGEPGDVVLVGYAWQAGYLASYHPGDQLPVVYHRDPTRDHVAGLFDRARRVWVLSYSPTGRWEGNRAEQYADEPGISTYIRQQGTMRARLFRRADAPALVLPGPAIAQVGPGLALAAARASTASATLVGGGELAVELIWQAVGPTDRDLTVFVQLLGPDGRVVAQQDNPPLGGARPTTTLEPGEVIVDPYRLQLPATLAPGDYVLQAGLYQLATGAREPATGPHADSDRVVLARYRVGS